MSYAPTEQQQQAIDALLSPVCRSLQLRACAGAGKTSTLVLMAEAYIAPSLYLAFNKAAVEEGKKRFPSHVRCSTTHSAAYAAFGSKMRNKLQRPSGKYVNVAGTSSEIARFFGIASYALDEVMVLTPACIGLMVKQTVARFESSADTSLSLDHVVLGDTRAKLENFKGATKAIKKVVLAYAKKLWDERCNFNSIVLATHDTYLKLFQLSKPVFSGMDVLYVDEFQDTTPCVMDIVRNQMPHMKVVMVGDARQAIYGWRGAVNAMEVMESEVDAVKMLTKSFRYGQRVADVATAILQGDMTIEGFEKIESRVGFAGEGIVDRSKPYTRLFRTNAALLVDAIEAVRQRIPVAIEIDTSDFVKLLQSAIALYQKNSKDVKHDKVVPFKDWDELLDDAKHDGELNRISKAVQGGQAYDWISTLERFQNAAEPHITFTTAHKSKGREWHQVVVESDFREEGVTNDEGNFVGMAVEEENLLYVACTRAQHALEYNNLASLYMNAFYDAKEAYASLEQDMTTWKEVA
jgi:superfamily I DNA/RNA helicase